MGTVPGLSRLHSHPLRDQQHHDTGGGREGTQQGQQPHPCLNHLSPTAFGATGMGTLSGSATPTMTVAVLDLFAAAIERAEGELDVTAAFRHRLTAQD
jgi:hypothetical protein